MTQALFPTVALSSTQQKASVVEGAAGKPRWILKGGSVLKDHTGTSSRGDIQHMCKNLEMWPSVKHWHTKDSLSSFIFVRFPGKTAAERDVLCNKWANQYYLLQYVYMWKEVQLYFATFAETTNFIYIYIYLICQSPIAQLSIVWLNSHLYIQLYFILKEPNGKKHSMLLSFIF